MAARVKQVQNVFEGLPDFSREKMRKVTFENKNDGRDWTLSDEQLGEYLLDSVGRFFAEATTHRKERIRRHSILSFFMCCLQEISLRY